MELIKQGSNYILKCTFAEKDTAKQASLRWNPTSKQWYTTCIDSAIKLINFVTDETLKTELQSYLDLKQTKIDNSKKANFDTNINLNHPIDKDYFPYQKAGINEMINRQNILLADEMGLGKTIQAIGLINNDSSIKKVLVICPASLKINWNLELKSWLTRNFEIQIWNGKSEPMKEDNFIIIINYDNIKKHFENLIKINFDLLIVDEAHYLKNPKTQRTQVTLGYYDTKQKTAISGIADNCKRKVFMTGTPIPNKPIEIFPILHTLDPVTYKNPISFGIRYCAGHEDGYGWNLTGNSHLDELQEKLRSTVMIRRLKKDVLTELPAKTRQIKIIPSEGIKSILKEQKLIKITDNSKESLVQALHQIKANFEEISKIRHEMGIEKIPFAIEDIEEYFENGINKLIIFAHHLEVIDAIYNQFKDVSVKITGEMNITDRQKSVEQFQNNPNIKLIVCSIKAAGVGLTLTAASNILFIEPDWTPGNNQQAEDRAHRIGQQSAVNIKYLIFESSLDARIVTVFLEKEEVIEEALDVEIDLKPIEKPILENEIQEIQNFENQNLKSKKENIVSPSPIHSSSQNIPEFTDEVKFAIIESLKYLTNRCNYASSLDGAGYNKFDTEIGHNLTDRIVSTGILSPKQLNLGKKILQKYKKQLPEELYNTIYSAN